MLKKLEDALSRLIYYFPFLGYYTSSWNIEETKRVPTMGTDYDNLYYNPEYCQVLKLNELAAVVTHEIVHNIFLHPSVVTRKQGSTKEQFLWTIALEMVTNAETIKILNSLNCDFKLPGKAISEPSNKNPAACFTGNGSEARNQICLF